MGDFLQLVSTTVSRELPPCMPIVPLPSTRCPQGSLPVIHAWITATITVHCISVHTLCMNFTEMADDEGRRKKEWVVTAGHCNAIMKALR